MIGVSGVSVTVSVRALLSSGCSYPETMYLCLYLKFFPRIKSEHLPVQYSSPPLRMNRLSLNKSLLCLTDQSMWESSIFSECLTL